MPPHERQACMASHKRPDAGSGLLSAASLEQHRSILHEEDLSARPRRTRTRPPRLHDRETFPVGKLVLRSSNRRSGPLGSRSEERRGERGWQDGISSGVEGSLKKKKK